MRLSYVSIAAGLALAPALGLMAQANPTASAADQAVIATAMSAAPKAVAEKATVVAPDGKGGMRTLRQGTGEFTCMPDNPDSPGKDPMCVDKNGMEWAQAWMGHTDPPAGKIGFGYMLQGGSDASNKDPYASKPTEGKPWVDTGPHVMIFNATSMMAGYPSQADNPDTKEPYVMWPGTPYAHLMIPVR
jgi:hypothetical protein